MHDLATIQRMNREATKPPRPVVGDRVTIINTDYHGGERGLVTHIDDDPSFPVQVIFEDGWTGWFTLGEISLDSPPEQIAQNVLDSHAIKDDWKRSGAQIRELLIEAVIEARR